MPRAKPKLVRLVTWPIVPPQKWRTPQLQHLLRDLDFNIKLEANACRTMLEKVASVLDTYHFWIAMEKTIPNRSERRVELRDAKANFEAAFSRLCSLSVGAESHLKHATIEFWKDQEDGPERMVRQEDITELIRCTQENLAVLIRYADRALTMLSGELRGRSPSPLPVLVQQLVSIFDRFYRGDQLAPIRNEARENFVRHVLTFSRIPTPEDLDRLLPKQ